MSVKCGWVPVRPHPIRRIDRGWHPTFRRHHRALYRWVCVVVGAAPVVVGAGVAARVVLWPSVVQGAGLAGSQGTTAPVNIPEPSSLCAALVWVLAIALAIMVVRDKGR